MVGLAVLVGAAASPTRVETGPTQAELDAAASNATDWLHTNHDYGGQRFVEATVITRQNAHTLQPACRYELGDVHPFQTSPIVHRRVMYLTSSSATVALDAVTCEVRWRRVHQLGARANWIPNRGVAMKAGKVIRGTRDGQLLALDAGTGRLLWERTAADATKGETFTMPPVVFEDLVIIGPAGGEVPIRGWVGAFRLETGEPVWRFNTVPPPGDARADTWASSMAVTGGGAVWTPFSLDPERGLVFIPVGNPAPDFYGEVRRGANLYTNSLVALDARTGKLVWHFQATSHDTHDWDLTQVSPIFSANVEGKRSRLVSIVGKDGLLRVLDREVRQQVYEVAVSRRENAEVALTPAGVWVCPGPLGGVQWNGPAFSPRTNMLYVPSVDWCATFRKAEELQHVPGQLYLGGSTIWDPGDQGRGWLTAIDASTGAVRWRYESRRPMVAAVTVTSADLVFTGELTGDFLVLDARDGTVLRRHEVGGAVTGGVVTYQIDGKQYVAVTSGSSGSLWRTPIRSAAVTIFSLPASGPSERGSAALRDEPEGRGGRHRDDQAKVRDPHPLRHFPGPQGHATGIHTGPGYHRGRGVPVNPGDKLTLRTSR
jgi:alcohol dehydrogenase (cytochrome c)